jgi:CPA2 family monovalent cation:H+ antiporter-2
MHLDPLIPTLVAAAFVVLAVGLLFSRLRQPQVIAYLLAGVAIGPDGIGIISDPQVVQRLGDAGVVLLLFFLGMEISLPRLLSNWRVPVLGTLIQIAASVGVVIGVGQWLGWPLARSVLLGFVISLSSTAVVIRMLHDFAETDTSVGHDVVGVLLVQDLALVPMLIVIGHMGGVPGAGGDIVLQIAGALGLAGLLLFLARGSQLRIPFATALRRDHELQVFAAFAVCFGMATATALLGLSSAVGAFVGGILVASARETDWVRRVLEPFHVLLVAFFFVSIGMLVDLQFVRDAFGVVLLLTALAVVTNTAINAAIFRFLGRSWPNSVYGGALLSQIGEFSFVLAAVGLAAQVINEYAYQATIAVIAMTMLVTPAYVVAMRRVRTRVASRVREPGSTS